MPPLEQTVSVKPVTYWTIACDRCGKDTGADSDYAAWSNARDAADAADDEGWLITDDEQHYCLDCWEWDENKGEQTPKPITGSQQ